MSRAGSQVMKMGRRGAGGLVEEKEEVEMEWRRVVEVTRVRIWESLSSSSGQMSGQWVKPK